MTTTPKLVSKPPTNTHQHISPRLPTNSPPPPRAATLLLTVSLPPTYPDTAPDLTLAFAPNTTKHPHLSLPDDSPALLAALEPTITENLGMAMIFALVSALKESAEQLVAERAGAAQAAEDAEKQKAEEEENRKFEGEKVTRETFLAWREGFRREAEEERERAREEREGEERRRRVKGAEEKMTGRMLWERGLVGKVVEEEEEEDGEDALGRLEGLKLKADG